MKYSFIITLSSGTSLKIQQGNNIVWIHCFVFFVFRIMFCFSFNQLTEFCLCNSKSLFCWRLGWPWFVNGILVSLGNRRDLTQDAELPLGFFYAPFPLWLPCIPAFLPSQCSSWRMKDRSLVPPGSTTKSWENIVISLPVTCVMWRCSRFYICAPGY